MKKISKQAVALVLSLASVLAFSVPAEAGWPTKPRGPTSQQLEINALSAQYSAMKAKLTAALEKVKGLEQAIVNADAMAKAHERAIEGLKQQRQSLLSALAGVSRLNFAKIKSLKRSLGSVDAQLAERTQAWVQINAYRATLPSQLEQAQSYAKNVSLTLDALMVKINNRLNEMAAQASAQKAS